MSDFATFVLSQLPPPPARVLEIGCGDEGGVTPALAAAGYDALGIDPRAPDGPLFRRITLEELDDAGPFAAVVAGRVLHHVHPLEPALDKLVSLAPLLVADEFSWDRIDEPTQDWYEAQHRLLAAAGVEPRGWASLDAWRAHHDDLHPEARLRAALDRRYETLVFERRPYLHRWLRGPASEALERTLIDAGAIQALGWVYAGVAKAPLAVP
jgi:Methyltransferase domain